MERIKKFSFLFFIFLFVSTIFYACTVIYWNKNPDKLITARRVAGLLVENKMSQERYAKMLHLSQPAISGKLSGTVKFTANDIWKTAVIFGVSTDYLYGLTDMRMREEAMTPV